MKMLQTLSNTVIDWMLPTAGGDIKTAFNDIPTGHTPTNTSSDDNFRDFSKWENLNTPTPLDKEPDNYFIYPPNSTIKVEPITESDHQSLHSRNVSEYYNDNNLQLFGVQYLKPLSEYENNNNNNNNYVTQPSPSTPLVYCNLEPYSSSSTTTTTTNITNNNSQEIKSEGQNDNLSLLSPITPVPNYNTNIIIDHWSTDDTSLHSGKFTMDMNSSLYTCPYDNSNDNVYTSLETHTPWTTYHNNNNSSISNPNVITTTNNNISVNILNHRDYIHPEIDRTCSPNISRPTSITRTNDQIFNRQVKNEYCCNTLYGQVMMSSELTSIHQNNKPQQQQQQQQHQLKLSDQQKPFVCGMLNCNKRFVRIDELKRHQRTHSEIKQFICDICKKGFTRSDHLMTHRRTHTGERPYECKLCDRRFARSDERNRHTKTHMRDKPRRGRKPRNANIQSTIATNTTTTTTATTTTITSGPIAPSTITTSTLVTNNFPTYNILPCYSMKMDYPSECKMFPNENKGNIV